MTLPANVASVGASLGLPAAEIEAGISSVSMKAKVKAASDEAIAKGVFGSPFFLVDGEPFWGLDRIPMLESWLETGMRKSWFSEEKMISMRTPLNLGKSRSLDGIL